VSRATTRAMFILLGGAGGAWTPPPSGECDPYTKPHHLSANVNLDTELVRVSNNSANVNLCEEMT
jgi:hypothetical protein